MTHTLRHTHARNVFYNLKITSQSKFLLDLLGKKSMSLHIGIFMNDLATEIKNIGLGITVEDHDSCSSIIHKSKTKLRFNNAN